MPKRRHYSLCLLAIASPIARAKIPIRGNNSPSSSLGATVSKFTKFASAKRDETPSSSSNAPKRENGSLHHPPDSRPTSSAADSKQDESLDEKSETSTSNPHAAHSSSSSISIAVGTGGTLSLIQHILSKSAGPILECVSICAQVAIAGYLTKATWRVFREVWEEVNEELSAARVGGSGGDVREEQDMPYADESALSGGLGEGGDESESDVDEENTLDRLSRRRRQSPRINEPLTPQMRATRELAARLHSAGIPYASKDSAEDAGEETMNSSHRTVEGIVRSLSRSEGNVLAQTLLTPLDGGLVDGDITTESPAAATAAWNAIGGLPNAKESLLDLAFPLLPTQSDPESNAYYGGLLANPPGALLYGPPGCGKSMLVRALAATVGARFLVVSPSCLLRKYVGETNLNVRALFSIARKLSPCVIFVDELDGLFRERGGEDHDVSRDLKTEFLQLWDGIRQHAQGGRGEGMSSSSVLVIGATNRPFDVDPAFLRRMPRKVFVGLPDYDARISVLQSMLNRVPLDPNFDLGLVASKTQQYSPSDIREVLQAAALYPLREARAEAMASSQIDAEEKDTNMPARILMPPLRKLHTDDVLRALQVAKPTHFSRRYQRDLMNYVRNSGGSHGSRSTTSPPITGLDEKENCIADAGTFSGNYFDQGSMDDESDGYYYDDDSSGSDYDEL